MLNFSTKNKARIRKKNLRNNILKIKEFLVVKNLQLFRNYTRISSLLLINDFSHLINYRQAFIFQKPVMLGISGTLPILLTTGT